MALGSGNHISRMVGSRDRYFDVLRAVALLRVGAYHLLGYGWLTIVFPSMGVMFAIAGSLVAKSLERENGSVVVRNRIRRLLPSFWVLGLIIVPIMLWLGWTVDGGGGRPLQVYELAFWIVPILDPPGSDWGYNATAVLWYVRAYLWFVLLSPILYWCFRRWPIATTLAPLVLITIHGADILDLYNYDLVGFGLIDFGTYGACWMLGFAHRTGAIQRMEMPTLMTVAGVAILIGGVWTYQHPDPDLGYDLNEIAVGQAFWSVGAVLLLLRAAPQLSLLDSMPVLDRVVTVINARALTIYLWHNIAIDVAVRTSEVLDNWTPLLLALDAAVFTMVAVLLFGWVEDLAARRRIQLLPSGSPRVSKESAPVSAG